MNLNSNALTIKNNDYETFKSRFGSLYLQKVKSSVSFLCKKQMHLLAGVVATFLIEPQNALYSGYLMHKGLNNKKIINLNLKSLSAEQINIDPVLFIHGDSSTSALFAPMINEIIKDHPNKPIFTIDLKSSDGIVSAKKHLNEVVAKVNDIQALYLPVRVPKISFVGHSSGGDIIKPLVKVINSNDSPQIGNLFKIGSIFKKNEVEEFKNKNVIEIVGTKDVLEGCHSFLPNSLEVVSGHLGLLFNKTVINYISKHL